MPILNYTTTFAAHKTVGQLQALLASKGATDVMVTYRDGRPDSLTFAIDVGGQSIPFRLPSRWEGVLAAMKRDPKVPRAKCKPEQALRVAWRIVKDWTVAQLALIDAGLATMPQVMLPYAVTGTGATFYERLEEEGPALLQLEAGDA